MITYKQDQAWKSVRQQPNSLAIRTRFLNLKTSLWKFSFLHFLPFYSFHFPSHFFLFIRSHSFPSLFSFLCPYFSPSVKTILTHQSSQLLDRTGFSEKKRHSLSRMPCSFQFKMKTTALLKSLLILLSSFIFQLFLKTDSKRPSPHKTHNFREHRSSVTKVRLRPTLGHAITHKQMPFLKDSFWSDKASRTGSVGEYSVGIFALSLFRVSHACCKTLAVILACLVFNENITKQWSIRIRLPSKVLLRNPFSRESKALGFDLERWQSLDSGTSSLWEKRENVVFDFSNNGWKETAFYKDNQKSFYNYLSYLFSLSRWKIP